MADLEVCLWPWVIFLQLSRAGGQFITVPAAIWLDSEELEIWFMEGGGEGNVVLSGVWVWISTHLFLPRLVLVFLVHQKVLLELLVFSLFGKVEMVKSCYLHTPVQMPLGLRSVAPDNYWSVEFIQQPCRKSYLLSSGELLLLLKHPALNCTWRSSRGVQAEFVFQE